MALRRGDVVLVPFPYAELTAAKTRPALIVSGKAFTSAEGRVTVAGSPATWQRTAMRRAMNCLTGRPWG
jgi:mRNA-degrading endonuclease toxin of MazEF toxin-antitoxin module